MIRLSKEDVINLQSLLLAETGGLQGIRDEGLLESALSLPFQTFDGIPLYPSQEQKAARLCYSLIMNHPFVDGNKRIGIMAMMVFLELNGIILACTDDELIDLGLNIASGKTSDKQILSWILSHE